MILEKEERTIRAKVPKEAEGFKIQWVKAPGVIVGEYIGLRSELEPVPQHTDEKRLPLIDWNKILNENTVLKVEVERLKKGEPHLSFLIDELQLECRSLRKERDELKVQVSSLISLAEFRGAELERLKKEMPPKDWTPECWNASVIKENWGNCGEMDEECCLKCPFKKSQNHQDGDKK